MISVKTGTQTWSASQQRTDHASDGLTTISPDEQKKFFGDQNVGDVLNKISDPNWVDPTKKARNVGNTQLDKDSFMKLLLTQMKHQDPTNPMQSHEMAAQLAQFTSLEKLTNISEGINALKKAQEPSQNFDALSFIGKAVAGDSARIDRLDQDDVHPITFNLGGDAQKVEIKIKDANQQVIRTLETANVKGGKTEVLWNGKAEDGSSAMKGTYTVDITAVSSNGLKVFADTKFSGMISGVNFTPQGPVLMIGKQTVALRDVKEIIDPRFVQTEMAQRLEVKQGAAPAPGQAPAVNKNNSTPTSTPASNLDNVGMSRGLINQLSKDGVKVGT